MNVTALPTALASIAQPTPTFRRDTSGLFVPDDRLSSGANHQLQSLTEHRRHTSLWLPGNGDAEFGIALGATPVLIGRPDDAFERLVRDGLSGARSGATITSRLAS